MFDFMQEDTVFMVNLKSLTTNKYYMHKTAKKNEHCHPHTMAA
jgi:hypothetical protein